MPEDTSTAENKDLTLEVNKLSTAAVESAAQGNSEKEPKQYLVYFDSPMKGRRLYLLTTDEYQADAAKRHIDKYFETCDRASIEVLDVGATVDEVPKYASSDVLYQGLWW